MVEEFAIIWGMYKNINLLKIFNLNSVQRLNAPAELRTIDTEHWYRISGWISVLIKMGIIFMINWNVVGLTFQ